MKQIPHQHFLCDSISRLAAGEMYEVGRHGLLGEFIEKARLTAETAESNLAAMQSHHRMINDFNDPDLPERGDAYRQPREPPANAETAEILRKYEQLESHGYGQYEMRFISVEQGIKVDDAVEALTALAANHRSFIEKTDIDRNVLSNLLLPPSLLVSEPQYKQLWLSIHSICKSTNNPWRKLLPAQTTQGIRAIRGTINAGKVAVAATQGTGHTLGTTTRNNSAPPAIPGTRHTPGMPTVVVSILPSHWQTEFHLEHQTWRRAY